MHKKSGDGWARQVIKNNPRASEKIYQMQGTKMKRRIIKTEDN